MRRTARLLTGTALAVVAASGPAATAHGADAGRLEVYPPSVLPGGEVSVNTRACGGTTGAAGDASAVGAGPFTLAPGTQKGDAIGQFQVPPGAQPGTYEIVAECAGDGRLVRGDLVVGLTEAETRMQPRGSVKTGVGGSVDRDPVRTAAGVAALAVAAAGGTWLLHRRVRGDDGI
ncbi:hypothetical protein ABZ920_11835 [Streptomyces sp. NPDC046831]|uniref:hypothetical protein n=1 Tax=Streptomyces sp. NPDC046831 TaxID=3154805 RepID=UPI0033E6C53D